MLGLIAFIILAIVVGVYATTSYVQYRSVPVGQKNAFVAAYCLLAVCALVWAGTFLVAQSDVAALVFMSNCLLLVASGCMLHILFDLSRPWLLTLVTLVASGLITARAFVSPPAAYVDNGLLHFNLTPAIALGIGLIFLVIWLPASVKVIHQAMQSPELVSYRLPSDFLFMSVVLTTSFFLTARRPEMIIILFASIIGLFVALLSVNYLIAIIQKSHHRKEAHGKSV